MGLRGRQQLPAEELKIRGTYRRDRHGKREQFEAACDGTPIKPKSLKGEASKWWDRNVHKIPRAIELDTDFIVTVAESWALLCRVKKQFANVPINKDSSGIINKQLASYYEGCRRLGLTPLDRSRLAPSQKEKPDEEAAPLTIFARKRGAS